MEQKELVKLAVERINNILKHECDTITSVYATYNDEIVVELSNGMNLNLSQGEVEYRAEQQIEERKVEVERHDAQQDIADHYIKTIKADALHGDDTILNALLMGEGMTPLDKMSDDNLCAEYKDLFNKDIIIMK
jgi:hypothetical protein